MIKYYFGDVLEVLIVIIIFYWRLNLKINMNFQLKNFFIQLQIFSLKNYLIQKYNSKIEQNNLMMNFMVIQIKYYGKLHQKKKKMNKKIKKMNKKKKKIQKIF